MDFLDNIKKVGILAAAVLIVLGGLCLVMPIRVAGVLALAVGLAIVVYGLYKLIFALIKRKDLVHPVFHIVLGVIALGTGIYVVFNRSVTISLIGILISICAFVAAADRFAIAVDRKRADLPMLSTLLFGVLHLCFGAAMLLIPKAGATIVVMICGFYLLISGIMILASVFYFKDYR